MLGSILLDPAAISLVVPILEQEDFYSDKHQRIYRGMLELFERSAEIDLLTLKEELNAGRRERRWTRRTSPGCSTACPTSATSSTTPGSSRKRRRCGA